MAYTVARLNAALDAANGPISHAQLHTDDPGSSGTSNILGQATRAAITFPSASSGSASQDVVFTITGATSDITYITFWDQASAGAFLASAGLEPIESFSGPGTFTVSVDTAMVVGFLNVLANPSAFGWPDATNTGLTVPVGTLTPSGALTVTTNGALIEELDIVDTTEGFGILVQANNVIIRNCRITTTPTVAGGCIYNESGTGLLIEDCEMFYTDEGDGNPVVHDDNYTMRRCYIHNVAEGPRVGSNVTIEDCYIHDMEIDNEEAHGDCLQTTSGENILVNHNTVIGNNVGTSSVSSVYIFGSELDVVDGAVISNNLFDGGGWTIEMGATLSFNDVTVSGNRFGRSHVFGPASVNQSGMTNFTWTNNVYDDDNSIIDP